MFRVDKTEAWVGLYKPLDTCDKDDYLCRRQGWLWEDDTVYDPNVYHEWCQCPWYEREPNVGELCVTIKESKWHGERCTDINACLCEKGVIPPEINEEEDCPYGWKKYEEECYLMTSEGLTHSGCVETCKKGKGVISSIATPKEHQVLVNL